MTLHQIDGLLSSIRVMSLEKFAQPEIVHKKHTSSYVHKIEKV